MRKAWFAVLALLAAIPAFLSGGARAAEGCVGDCGLYAYLPSVLLSEPRPMTDKVWAIAGFGGALTKDSFVQSLVHLSPNLTNDYIAGGDLSYKFYQFSRLPIDLELDMTIAKRFGVDHQWDFGILPMLRWTEFPWNNYVYTNFRIGLIGFDYVTGVSPWELHWAGNNHGSHYLNYLSVEVDVRTSKESPWEFFFRSHHRSGIFGLINDTWGGSTYMTLGARYQY